MYIYHTYPSKEKERKETEMKIVGAPWKDKRQSPLSGEGEQRESNNEVVGAV